MKRKYGAALARETLAEKPSFRAAYRRRRCLVLADGFFEWAAIPGEKAKQPHYITLKDGSPFAFAGLWEQWFSPDGSEIKSATIITTEPNAMMAKLHDRMPVILKPKDYARWIDPDEQPPEKLQDLLVAADRVEHLRPQANMADRADSLARLGDRHAVASARHQLEGRQHLGVELGDKARSFGAEADEPCP